MKAFLDAAQTVIFARQLEEIDGQLYDVKYAKLEALELVSAKALNPGAESYTYRQYDARAIAKFSSNYANGSPRADVSGLEFTAFVKSCRQSFGFNVQEIRAAAMAGLPLDAMRAMAARRGINEALNAVALQGNAEFGLPGLFSLSSTNTVTIPNGAVGASPLWSTKSGDEIVADMVACIDKIPTVTLEVENPKRLLMSYSRLRFIMGKRLNTTGAGAPIAGGGDRTVLEQIKQVRPGVEVRGALLLDTAGAGSTQRMMAYDPDRTNMEWLLPVPFESFPPQLQGMEWVIECHARAGGVVLRYPLTVCYADGI